MSVEFFKHKFLRKDKALLSFSNISFSGKTRRCCDLGGSSFMFAFLALLVVVVASSPSSSPLASFVVVVSSSSWPSSRPSSPCVVGVVVAVRCRRRRSRGRRRALPSSLSSLSSLSMSLSLMSSFYPFHTDSTVLGLPSGPTAKIDIGQFKCFFMDTLNFFKCIVFQKIETTALSSTRA